MNNLITRLREAAEDLRKDMGRKDLRTKDILLLSDIRDIAVECADMIERQAAEIARLNQALKWQQDRADRIGTHGDGCWSWGHKHYECALDAIARLKKDAERYWWLRIRRKTSLLNETTDFISSCCMAPEELDAAIDAAMREKVK